jgi:hypothetical protein
MAFNVVHNAVTYTSNLAIPGLANTGAVYVTANGNSLIYDANGRIVVGGAGTVGLYDSSNTGIYFQKQTSASESNVPYIRAEGDSTTTHLALGPSSSSGTLRFYTGGYERARVDSAGNFGLGITPSSWTSSWKAIQIGSGSTYSMYGSGSIGFGIISNAYYNGSSYIYTNSTSTPAGLLDFNIASIGGWTWRIASANTAGNAVSFSNVMTLNNSGYLGIGATSPSTNLTIGGTAAGSGASGGLGVFLSRGNTTNFFEAYDSTKSFIAGVDNTQTFAKVGTLSSHDLGIVTGNSSKIYVKNSTGYVGIGTTNPTQLLEIAANSHSYAEVYLHNDDTTTGDFGTQAMFRLGAGGNPIGSLKTTVNPLGGLSTQALYLTTEGSYPIAFGINNSATPSMILDTSGNLGLGVTPSSWSTGRAMEFSVVGNSIWGYNGEMIIGNNIAGYGSGNFKYGQSAAASYYGMQLGQHQWYVAPSGNANSTISFTQVMTLDSSGNLLVGDTSAQYSAKLYINGSIAARNSGVDGSFANAFVAGYTSNYNERNVIQTAVSSIASGSGFRFQVSNGGGSASVTTALDVTRSTVVLYSGGTESVRVNSKGILSFSAVTTLSSPTANTWYTVYAMNTEAIYLVTVRSVRASNEQFTTYIFNHVVGALWGATQLSNYTVGSGDGNAIQSDGSSNLQVQVNASGVTVYVTVIALSGG